MPDTLCPDQEVLHHFLLGQVAADEADQLAQHVEQCARCVQILQALHPSDPLLEAMQSPPVATDLPPLAEVESFVQRMSPAPQAALQTPSAAGSRVGDDTQEIF